MLTIIGRDCPSLQLRANKLKPLCSEPVFRTSFRCELREILSFVLSQLFVRGLSLVVFFKPMFELFNMIFLLFYYFIAIFIFCSSGMLLRWVFWYFFIIFTRNSWFFCGVGVARFFPVYDFIAFFSPVWFASVKYVFRLKLEWFSSCGFVKCKFSHVLPSTLSDYFHRGFLEWQKGCLQNLKGFFIRLITSKIRFNDG